MNIKQQLEQVIAEMSGLDRWKMPISKMDNWAARLSTIVEQMPSESAEPVAWAECSKHGEILQFSRGPSEPACRYLFGFNMPLYATPQVPDGMVLVPEVLLRQISKWLAESADPYDKAAYAINGLIAAAKEEG